MPSLVEDTLVPARIRVRQGSEYVALAPGTPLFSSAQSPWDGALLESHAHGPHTAEKHQHLSHFVCLHLGEPAPLVWRSEGKQGNKIIGYGSTIVVSRGTEDTVSFPKPVKRILLNLEPAVFSENDTGRDVELIARWGVQDPQVQHILRALEADLQAGAPGGRLFGDSLLCALAAHLQRSYAVVPHRGAKTGNGLPRTRLNRVIEYIEANIHLEIALATLAHIAGMTPHYFSELFKQSVQCSPYQYVLRRRIELAQKLLQEPAATVLEVALRSGFSDQSHFTKIFRRVVGVTPTAYRAAL